MNVTLICLGKLKEQYLRNAAAEYQKRLTPFCKFTLVELQPERLPDEPSRAQIEAALQTEAKKIAAKMPPNAAVFSLCIEGKKMSSEGLSALISDTAVSGVSDFVFIIGSSYGLAEEIKKSSGVRLSMSDMTFPHQLARIMLLEQIYRAFQISANSKYHK